MSPDDWYRRTTWDVADREAFCARLARSRTAYNKAQYLRIQAAYLVSEYPSDALELLKQAMAIPSPTELSSVYKLMADCLDALDRVDEALDYYRRAMAQEEVEPQWLTDAYQSFADLVIRRELQGHYRDAVDVLRGHVDRPSFPLHCYQYHRALAILSDRLCEPTSATAHAKAALQSAGLSHSGFWKHPELWLVESTDLTDVDDLVALANR